MANIKIGDLVTITDPVSTDVLPIVDVSADTTNKISIADMLKNATTGSASNPSFAFDGDSNTGMYRSGADALALSTGGTGRLFIDSSGNVGIGVTPAAGRRLHVSGVGTLVQFDSSNTSTLIKFTNSAASGGFLGYQSDNLVFYTGNTERARIASSGNVGIKTSAPSYALDISSTDNNALRIRGTADNPLVMDATDSGPSYVSVNRAGTRVAYYGFGGSNDNFSLINETSTGSITLGTNSTTRVSILSSGNVGIGMSSPTRKLEIYDSSHSHIAIKSGDTGQSSLFFTDDSDANIGQISYLHSDNYMLFRVYDAERMRIDSSGRVGIGTASPNHKLTLEQSGTATFDALNIRNGNTNNAGYQIGLNTSGGVFHWNSTNSDILFATNGTERLRIDSSGNVGIGTSSPSGSLHVDAASGVDGPIFDSGGAGNTNHALIVRDSNNNQLLRVNNNGRVGIGTSSPLENFVVSDGGAAGLEINPSGLESGPYIQAYNRSTSSTVPLTLLSSELAIRTGGSERMRIDSSGNVGIGTSSITAFGPSLQVSGSDPAFLIEDTQSVVDYFGTNVTSGLVTNWYDDAASWRIGTATGISGGGYTERMRIDSSGNVGIGRTPFTSIAGYPLQLRGSSQAYLHMSISAHGDTYDDGFTIGTDSGYAYIVQRENSPLNFYTNNTERMQIDSSGRLLVGVSSSYANSGADDLQVGNNSSSTVTGISLGSTAESSIRFADASDASAGIIEYAHASDSMRLYTDGTERMRIGSNGFTKLTNDSSYLSTSGNYHELRSNTADWTARITNSHGSLPEGLAITYSVTPNGTGNHFLYCNDATALRASIRSNGGFANYQSNDANLCDEREKKNIETLDSTWNCLKNWELKKFHYNEDADTDDKRYGVIAQQVAPHCPEVITDWVKQKAEDAVIDDNGNVVTPAKEEIVRMGVKEQQMYWMAIKALQEAQERIETLEQRLTDAGL
jgi:hypothetical protein